MAALDDARTDLIDALGVEAVLADPLALRLYARDASMVEGGAGLVVFVRSAGDGGVCMRVAARHDLPVVPRGSGTGLAGGATPIADAIVVVTAKMNRILEVRPEDRLAWVEPGVFNLDLGNALRPTGFTYAPDPSSQQVSSIGGNVNTNAGGPHCLAYGVTSAHVLAVDVVLPDGSVERFGSEGPAAPGYDLRGYVVGSEGTLGIVTAVCVRLTPLPPAVRTMLLDFADVEDCAQTVSAIIARGVVPAALEMMDRGIVRAVEAFAHAGYPTDAAAVLLVEVDGLPAGVEAQTREVEAAALEHGVGTIRIAADETERALLWKGRKSAFGAIARIAPHYHLHDCVVPRTALADVLAGVYAIAQRHDLIVTNVFHAGDGNLHPLFSFDRSVPGTLERVLAASDELVRLCVDAGGSLSGEHGIGLEKRDFMPLVFTAEDLDAQACLRAAFDPDGRMNPRKVLPDGAPDDATVGGVIAAGVTMVRQIRVGAMRDSIVEMEVVTGDGRLVKSGARTVKNVTGYDVHRLLTGSLGTLGTIVQVALKVRPLPKATRTLVSDGGGPELGRRVLDAVPLTAAVLAEPDRIVVRLEGWPEEVEDQTRAAGTIAAFGETDAPFPEACFPEAAIVAEAAVAPSRLDALLAEVDRYRAVVGFGIAWVPFE